MTQCNQEFPVCQTVVIFLADFSRRDDETKP